MDEYNDSVDVATDTDVSDVDVPDDFPADIPDDIPEDVPEEIMVDDAEYAEDDEFIEEDSMGLENDERRDIEEETGWSKDIVDKIDTAEQADIYKKAELTENEINDRKCLVKDIDLDYTDPKTGKTNRELMALGRSPFDSTTGERIELHHMGQEYDSPFAELCENSEHGDGNDMILHDKNIDSWRQDDKLKNRYNNVDRPKHWAERLKKIESEA